MLHFFSINITVPQLIQALLPHAVKVSAKVGDSIELDCSSDGYPHSEALWYKYNIPLLDITYRKLEDTLKSASSGCRKLYLLGEWHHGFN